MRATDAGVWLLVDADPGPDRALLELCEQLLEGPERTRLAGLTARSRRREFLLGHALARVALSALRPSVGVSEWRLAAGADGRPRASAPGGVKPALSIAHTRGLLAVAVAGGGEIGVDVEWCGRRPPALAVAERFFAAAEVDDIRGRAGTARIERFLAYWTMKEAYLKARGAGLRLPLRGIRFSLPAGDAPAWVAGDAVRAPEAPPPVAVRFSASLDDSPSCWTFRRWARTGSHLVGLAQRQPASAPRLRELDLAGLGAAIRVALTSR